MAKLKQTFERLGFERVKTFIASGNVIFVTDSLNKAALTKLVEAAIEQDFGFPVDTLLRDLDEMAALVKALPQDWVNDVTMKCDVMFLWAGIDNPKIMEQIPHKPEIEDVHYFPGAVVWRVDRDKINKGRVLRIIGTDIYKQLAIRNSNSLRKIYALMLATNRG